MRRDRKKPPTSTGYGSGPVTKAPNWHGLVAFDMLFNNLATGLFLVAAICELAVPATFTDVATTAYPIALVLLVADLACLVLDLGNSLRFHHMLRVFKPSSPMSLGTWCLTAYSVPLTVLAGISVLPVGGVAVEWLRWLAMIAGLPAALGSALYKGVLFSTSSQPVWRDARWLGGYLTNSALMLGCAGLLALSILLGQDEAVGILRPALGLLLLLNAVSLGLLVVDVRRALVGTGIGRLGIPAVSVGFVAPLILLAVGEPVSMLTAVLAAATGALVIRLEIVRLPHILGQTK